MKGKPIFGKNHLHWCFSCGVPVLSGVCGRCGGKTKKVDITPPYDARPAFRGDIVRINECCKEQFGDRLLSDNEAVVLSRAPYIDRMDEIVACGEVLASIRFNPFKMRWEIVPRIGGALRMDLKKGYVEVDEDAVEPILAGGSVLAVGVTHAHPDIKKGDEVVVLCGDEVVACGNARMDGTEMVGSRGMAVKVRWRNKSGRKDVPEPVEMDDVRGRMVEANSHVIENIEKEAISFIKNVSKMSESLTVSYSGGKDSLAVLILCLKALGRVDILFTDTGLEFPETIENVEAVAEKYGIKILKSVAEDSFWKNLDRFGPPSVEYRWCCKVCKLGPISKLIAENYPDGCVSFIGQRRYESETRARSKRVWKTQWIGNQVGASPIQNWCALHVWLYIFANNAPYNRLYELGFERIGCWLCPSSSLSDFLEVATRYPEMWDRWHSYLKEYAEANGLDEKWVELGIWRWLNPPREFVEVMKKRMETTSQVSTSQLLRAPPSSITLSLVSGVRPCVGGVSAEGRFSNFDMNLVRESGQLRTLGKVVDGGNFVVVYGKTSPSTIHIYKNGVVIARAESEERTKNILELVEKVVRRAYECTGCGLCKSHCKVGAIEVMERAVINERCEGCGACLRGCPIMMHDVLPITEPSE